MASCDSEADALEAMRARWRVFRTREPGDPLLPGEAMCPASAEWEALGRRRRTCVECGQCGGDLQEGSPSRAIVSHGFRATKARQPRLPLWKPRGQK